MKTKDSIREINKKEQEEKEAHEKNLVKLKDEMEQQEMLLPHLRLQLNEKEHDL